MDRRRFLREAGRAAIAAPPLAALLAACTSSSTSAPPTSATTRSPSPSHGGPPPWDQLSSKLSGSLILPSSSSYATARLAYDPRFDGVHPAAIVKAASAQDVAATIAFARTNALPFAARAGGHSYGGYSLSTGIVIDLSAMAHVQAQPSSHSVTIGPGARLIQVATALAQSGSALPGGTCATVGISGLTMGGGQGVLGRNFGLTCDSLTSADVVLADGSTVTANATTHPDLYWALRGGGGGNFGVVTSFTFSTHALSQLTVFSLEWPWSAAEKVTAAWQSWAPAAPAPLWSSLRLRWIPGSGPSVSVAGAWSAAAAGLPQHLKALAAAVGSAPTSSVQTMSYLAAEQYFAGCTGYSLSECALTIDGGKLSREASLAKSDFFTKPMSSGAIGSLLGTIEDRAGTPALASQSGGVLFDSWGGKIAQVAPNATALPARNSTYLAQEFVTFDSLSSSAVSANQQWLGSLWQGLRSSVSGLAYVNYIDPQLSDWQQAYYGSNLARLVQVKQTYDPDDVFRFAQSIPVST
ncbi:MAG TPA: FAD-dependent oxidoreductase [Actinomycetota bacterium]|nr:FAD-dependent oxidoreductase [Actinomycetota bacterium]